MIFFLFEPLNREQKEFDEIPMIELENFTLSQLNKTGLTSITKGSKGIRYEDRYTVEDINHTDNSKKYLANIKAKDGLYKGEVLDLVGDVIYVREDGLLFETQKANYNTQTKIMIASTDYVSYMGKNRATGSYLKYNNILERTYSKNVTINYKLKER